jgi:hypothetical protein
MADVRVRTWLPVRWQADFDHGAAAFATILGYFRELDGSAYRRGTMRAKRVAVTARLRYTARALEAALFDRPLELIPDPAMTCPQFGDSPSWILMVHKAGEG